MTETRTASGSLEDLVVLAGRLLDAGQDAAADDVARQVLDQAPTVAPLWFYRAIAAANRYDFRQAFDYIEKAIEINDRKPRFHEFLLKLYERFGLYERALRHVADRARGFADAGLDETVDRIRTARDRLSLCAYRHQGDERIDLSDATFIVPLYVESEDRLRNLEIVLRFISRHFRTRVLVVEDTGKGTSGPAKNIVSNLGFDHVAVAGNDSPYFHKTWMINHGVEHSTTPMVVVHDSDVVMDRLQYVLARDVVRDGNDVVFPYNGTCVDTPIEGFTSFAGSLDISRLDPLAPDNGYPGIDAHGGAVFFSRRAMEISGGFNETIVAWGLEDREMIERLEKLGMPAHRGDGPLFHLRHARTVNSNETHPFWEANVRVLETVRGMDRTDLAAAVSGGRFRRSLIRKADLA